jgi:hypothetical protein
MLRTGKLGTCRIRRRILMFRELACVGGDKFESACINLHGNALTNHAQGHNKAKAVAFFQDDADYARQRAGHDAYLVSYSQKRVGLNRLTSNDAPEQSHIAIRDRDRPQSIADRAQQAGQPHEWAMILGRQSDKDVIWEEWHLEIDDRTIFPRSLRGIERKELFDANTIAKQSDALFMPGHCVSCKPLPLGVALTCYAFFPIVLFGCSFAIVT